MRNSGQSGYHNKTVLLACLLISECLSEGLLVIVWFDRLVVKKNALCRGKFIVVLSTPDIPDEGSKKQCCHGDAGEQEDDNHTHLLNIYVKVSSAFSRAPDDHHSRSLGGDMAGFAFAVPVVSGKEELDRKTLEEIAGPRLAEHEAALRAWAAGKHNNSPA